MNTQCLTFWVLLSLTILGIISFVCVSLGVKDRINREGTQFIIAVVMIIGVGALGWGLIGSLNDQVTRDYDFIERCYKTDNAVIIERNGKIIYSDNSYRTYQLIGNAKCAHFREEVSYNMYWCPLSTNYSIVGPSIGPW